MSMYTPYKKGSLGIFETPTCLSPFTPSVRSNAFQYIKVYKFRAEWRWKSSRAFSTCLVHSMFVFKLQHTFSFPLYTSYFSASWAYKDDFIQFVRLPRLRFSLSPIWSIYIPITIFCIMSKTVAMHELSRLHKSSFFRTTSGRMRKTCKDINNLTTTQRDGEWRGDSSCKDPPIIFVFLSSTPTNLLP